MRDEIVNAKQSVDASMAIILGMSTITLLVIVVVVLYFLFKYNSKNHPKAGETKEHVSVEVTWIAFVTVVMMLFFYLGYDSYIKLRAVPKDARVVEVDSFMFGWQFQYENGIKSDTLKVPVGEPVHLKMTSRDVLHAFYAPEYRIKVDTVPGMITEVWFNPEEEGVFKIKCAEYCGTAHSFMVTDIEVMSRAAFKEWYADAAPVANQPGEDMVLDGFTVAQEYGCIGCHTLDGRPSLGPTLQDYGNSEVTFIRDGAEMTMKPDREYIIDAIVNPGKDVTKGFSDSMPPYDYLSEEELEAIVDWLENGAVAK